MSKSKPSKARTATLLQVQILEAKPNPMFTEDQRSRIRFLRFNQHVACAHCGKKRRLHWTALYAFRSMPDLNSPEMRGRFSLDAERDGKPFPPLTPVCVEHCLAMDWPKRKRR